MYMQIAQRKYEETRSRVEAQRARQEQQKQQGTALQRLAGETIVQELHLSFPVATPSISAACWLFTSFLICGEPPLDLHIRGG